MKSVMALVRVLHPSPESMNLMQRDDYIKSIIDSDHHDRIIISDTEEILFKITVFVPKKICLKDDRGLIRQFIQKKINPEKKSNIEIVDFTITG